MKINVDKIKQHSLTGRITLDFVHKAFKTVKRNRGCAGVDRVSIDTYMKNLDENLHNLMKTLKDRSYKTQPLRRTYIRKERKGNKMRPLGIPTIRCRIAQEVVRKLVEPNFEKRFHENSFGFRPGRGCADAVRKVLEYLKGGYCYILDADVEGFFDNIPHELIMKSVAARIADGNILGLIQKFLKSGVMEEGKRIPTTKGTPQGGVISPLLSNIVLDHLDWYLESKGYRFVRYADDFVVLCKTHSQAKKALADIKWLLEEEMELTLSKEKTHITHMSKGFDFLGFRIFGPNRVTIRDKSMEKFKETIKEITKRKHNLDKEVIKRLNAVTRGFVNYFNQPFSSVNTIFYRSDKWIRSRIRQMKKKRRWKTDNMRLLKKHIRNLGVISCWDLCRASQLC